METQTILNVILLAISCALELIGVFATIMEIKDEPENVIFILCGVILVVSGYCIYKLISLVQM